MEQRSIPLLYTCKVFFEDRAARGFAASTVAWYRVKVGGYATWMGEGALLTDCTAQTLRTYLVLLRTRAVSDYTLLGVARALRAFFNWCVAEELLALSPMAQIPNPKIPKRIEPAITPESARLLLQHAPDARARALLLFLLDTGVRAAECAALNGEDVDLASGTVHIRKGKGNKARTVYMGAASRRALLRYYNEAGVPVGEQAVWRTLRGAGRLTDSGMRQLLGDIGKAAGVADCTPHAFRRAFALWNLRKGMNIYVLARLMGHADIVVLRRYLDLVETDLADAHGRAAAVDAFLR